MALTKKAHRALMHTAYNQGYQDALNARAPLSPDPANPDYTFHYLAGHCEGWPKRLVETIITTAHGPVRERCTVERAAFLLASNARMPGGRR